MIFRKLAVRKLFRRTLLLAACVSLLASLPVAASEVRIPSVTRLVHVFAQRESRLSDAVQKRDSKAVSTMLAKNFEMRVATMPGNPVPRAAWIRQSFAESYMHSAIEQMAVHGYNRLAIVSFRWTIRTGKIHSKTQRFFIVDTWREEGGSWKLAVRYAAVVGESHATIPGGIPPTPAFKKME